MMSSSSSGSSLAPFPSLSGETLSSLFPFYIHFDRDFQVLSCGPSLRKACPDVIAGQLLTTLFTVERPRIPLTIESLSASVASLFLLKHLGSPLQLRGQLVPAENNSFLILGSPWIRKLKALSECNLSIGDFAIHDSTPEVVQSWVSQEQAVTDLRRVAAKLERQRAELHQAIETIREGELQRRLLSLIVSHSKEAVAVTDSSQRIIWINEVFTRLTGYSLAAVRRLALGTLLQGEKTDAETVSQMSIALDANQGFRSVLANYRKDGQLFWNDMEVEPLLTDSGNVANFVAVLRDVTAERDEAARNALLLSGTRILAEARDAQEAVYKLMGVICEAVGACYGGLWWVCEETKSLHLVRFWASEAVQDSLFLKRSESISYKAGEGLPGQVWLSGCITLLPWVEDLETCPRNDLARSAGLRGCMAFPVRTGSVASGVVELFCSETDSLPTFLLPVIESLAVQIGQFVERFKAESERDRSLSLLKSALDSTPDAVVLTDLQGLGIRFNDRWPAILRIDGSIDPNRWHEHFIRQLHNSEEQMAEWVRLRSQRDMGLTANFLLMDGRTIETVTNPHRHDGQIVGQVWQFRDVTKSLAETRERESLLSILNSTLEATNDGILVTGLARERIVFNQRFLDMWRIPRSVAEVNRGKSLTPFVLDQLVDPAAFTNRLNALDALPVATATDVFELSDERVYELYSQPVRIGERIIGRIWCYRDVSAGRKVLRQLQKSEERYRFVSEAAPDPIVTFGPDGVIQFANQMATARFCGLGGRLIGTPVSFFFPDSKAKVYSRWLRRLLAGTTFSKVPALELSLLDASGQLFPAEVNIDRSFWKEGRQFTAVVRDISLRKAMAEQLLEAATAAAAANQAKSDFLANISHEIRTPLNAIVGLTEILRAVDLSADLRESVDSIWVSAESLLALINDLLDISKIEAGQVDIELQNFDPAEIAEQAVDMVRIRAAAKSITVYFIVEPTMPAPLRGDPNRIRQVLVNLLSNAIKFTDAGSVTLRLRWEQTDSGVSLHYSVTDTGIGMAPFELTRIFENFYRIESPSTAQSGGAGLGLGISRAIATRLGGSLSVTSALGKGSCFSFSLPGMQQVDDVPGSSEPSAVVLVATLPARIDVQVDVLRSAGFAVVPCTDRLSWPENITRFALILVDEEWADFHDWEPPPSAFLLWLRMTGRAAVSHHRPVLVSPLTPARLRRAIDAMGRETDAPADLFRPQRSAVAKRILLVDDHPAGQMYVRKLLTGQGYVVFVAARAKEAREMLRHSVFDLVLMDVQLPDGFGPDLIEEFRALEAATNRPKTPLIALSAHALEKFKSAALAAGADDYVTKPVRPGALLQLLRNWLSNDIRVLILAQAPEILSTLSAMMPSATAASIDARGPVELPVPGVSFDVVIIAAQWPSREFVDWVLSTVAPFPNVNRVLLGKGWTDDLMSLAGGSSAFAIPESVVELDRLVRQNAHQASGPADRQTEVKLGIQIAGLAPSYLRGLAESLDAARGSLGQGNLADIATFAHRLKGTGAAFGFPKLTQLASILEKAAGDGDTLVVNGLVSTLAHDVSALLAGVNDTQ